MNILFVTLMIFGNLNLSRPISFGQFVKSDKYNQDIVVYILKDNMSAVDFYAAKDEVERYVLKIIQDPHNVATIYESGHSHLVHFLIDKPQKKISKAKILLRLKLRKVLLNGRQEFFVVSLE